MGSDLAYIAGFFDGEGNVGIYAGGARGGRTLRAQITQANHASANDLLVELQGRWGGSISAFNRAMRRAANAWQVGGPSAYRFLSDIRPHVRLKRDQIDLALLWFESRSALRRTAAGRIAPRPQQEVMLADRVAALLVRMKKDVDQVMADAADLVEVRYELRQIVNVKGG